MKGTVLIIDDDLELAMELQEILNMSGYDVEVLAESLHAVEWIERIKPKVVLLDLKMAPKSGFQIADDLKYYAQRNDIVLIAMSGHFTEKEHRFLMEQCGIEAFLTKPFNPLNLISKIELTLSKNEEENAPLVP